MNIVRNQAWAYPGERHSSYNKIADNIYEVYFEQISSERGCPQPQHQDRKLSG